MKMQNILMDRYWMIHEGGSKYYQVFQFRPEDGRDVTVTHWGSAGSQTEFGRPVNGGQTQIKKGALGITSVNKKKARGYYLANSDMSSKFSDSPWFVEHFGASDAFAIKQAMFHDYENSAPTPVPETKGIKAAPEVSPDGWGSW
jgi:hypothetical protein